MSNIIINNCNECTLDIPQKYALKLYQELSIRHPNAFYLRGRIKEWDGKVHFLNKYGKFKIGLLPRIYKWCKEQKLKVNVIDKRLPIPKAKAVKTVGDFKLRSEQFKVLEQILANKIGDVPYYIGVLDLNVGFGKTLIMSALYYSFGKKLRTLLITNDSDWLQQAKSEFKEYLPGEDITFVQGSKVTNWSNFSIGMVQSISRNIKVYQRELAKVDMVLVDEADLAGSKSYQSVLSHLYNTRVRLGLSGTIYVSALKRDLLKNMNLEAYFGQTISEFRLRDSIKKGYSTNVVVKLVDTEPWYSPSDKNIKDYKEEYDKYITDNVYGYKCVYDRLKKAIKYGNLPALIVCKHIKHCEKLYNYIYKELGSKYKIEYVHVNTNKVKRNQIMKRFREGDIDILVSTTLISRGKNFPKLRYMVNAAGMSSEEKTIQLLGRLVRLFEGKNKVYLDDIQYKGNNYLSRHSKRRARYYRREKLKVINLSKIWNRYRRYSSLYLPF